MANFRRHLEIATLASGMLSSVCMGAGFVRPYEAVALWITGSLGGLLPDIDSDNSSSLDIVFSLVSLFFVIAMFSNLYNQYATLTLWGGGVLIVVFINFAIRPLFEAITVHRGVFHSIVAGLFFTFSATNLAYYFGNLSVTFSWLIGLFLLAGFITHLLLDEIYSVDLSNARIKRSFGTALKLISYNNWKTSILMTIITILSYSITPKPTELYNTLTDKQLPQQIKNSFLPSFFDT